MAITDTEKAVIVVGLGFYLTYRCKPQHTKQNDLVTDCNTQLEKQNDLVTECNNDRKNTKSQLEENNQEQINKYNKLNDELVRQKQNNEGLNRQHDASVKALKSARNEITRLNEANLKQNYSLERANKQLAVYEKCEN